MKTENAVQTTPATPVAETIATITKLTAGEKRQLAQNEKVLQNHFNTFREAGSALQYIRDNRLYRDQHATFEIYCRLRWKLSKTQANRLIAAAEVVHLFEGRANLRPVLNNLTESSVRPLTSLTPETQLKVLEHVAETEKAGEPVTAKTITQVAREIAPTEVPAAAVRGEGPTQDVKGTARSDLVRRSEVLDAISEYVKSLKSKELWDTISKQGLVAGIRNAVRGV